MRSDRDLILAYLAGREEAFAEFYRKHARGLYVYLLSLVRSRETAEELLQETYLGLLSHLERLELKENMKPFLFTTARNLARDWLRRERRGRAALARRQEDPFFRPGRGYEASYPAAPADAEEVSRLLHRLPDAQREAVVLKELSGLTFREISRLLGVPEGTVVSRYRYALEKLRGMAARRLAW
jgi:RNA polymerase sigma-70 factor (ECF subfamily)